MNDMNSPTEEQPDAKDDSEDEPPENDSQNNQIYGKNEKHLRLIGIVGGLGLSVFFQAIGQTLVGLVPLAVAIGIPFLLSGED